MKARALSLILLSFVLGIWLAPLSSFDFNIIPYILVGFISLAIVFYKNLYFRTFLLLVAAFFGAIYRYEIFQQKNNPQWMELYKGEEVEIVGVVDSEPAADKVTKFVLDIQSINEEMVEGKTLVTVHNFPTYTFGDKVELKGRLREPPEFEDFSYKDYLSRFGVFTTMDFPDVLKTKSQYMKRSFSENIWFRLRLLLSHIRDRFEKSIEEVLPEPHASFMEGLLLGVKRSIPDWLLDDFNASGTTHIIALSGFNITIIVQILRNMTKSLSRRLSFWLPISGVFLFVVLTGAQASVVRAAIMGSMLLLSRRFGRQSTAYIAVALTAALMIFLNPLILRFDIGFQLSFAALLGLIYISPIFERLFIRLPKVINENLSLTLAAQIAAAPIIIYNFGRFSLIAPVSNILILPLIPFVMSFGFLAATLGMFAKPLGQIFAWISFGFLEYMIKVVGYLAEAPYASVNIDLKSPIYIFVYYMIILDIIFIIKFKQRIVFSDDK